MPTAFDWLTPFQWLRRLNACGVSRFQWLRRLKVLMFISLCFQATSNHFKQHQTISNNFKQPQTILNNLKQPQTISNNLKPPQTILNHLTHFRPTQPSSHKTFRPSDKNFTPKIKQTPTNSKGLPHF